MKYRKASSKDSKGIANVLVQSYNIKTINEAIGIFKDEAKRKYNYIVADSDGKIVGIVTWQMHGLPKHELCELDRIAVLPKFQGEGIAKELFSQLIKYADAEYKKSGFGLRKLYILTHARNKRAQSFYEKMGCSKEAVLKNHYYSDEDELVYSKFFN